MGRDLFEYLGVGGK